MESRPSDIDSEVGDLGKAANLGLRATKLALVRGPVEDGGRPGKGTLKMVLEGAPSHLNR